MLQGTNDCEKGARKRATPLNDTIRKISVHKNTNFKSILVFLFYIKYVNNRSKYWILFKGYWGYFGVWSTHRNLTCLKKLYQIMKNNKNKLKTDSVNHNYTFGMALKLQKGPRRCFLWLNEARHKVTQKCRVSRKQFQTKILKKSVAAPN